MYGNTISLYTGKLRIQSGNTFYIQIQIHRRLAETLDIGEIPIRDTESKMTWRVEKIKTALSVMLFNWLCLFQFSMLNHIHV